MKKNVFGRKFKRDHNERKALFKSLASELVLHDSIKTTEAKAKAVKPLVERLVTKARIGGLHAERQLRAHLVEPAVRRMMDEVAPRFVGRNGGYTRIIKMPNRLNDNASVATLEWVEKKATNKADKPVTIESSKPVEETNVVEGEVVTSKPVAKKAEKPTAKKAVKKTTKPKKENK